jgi:hypothetical protein
MAQRKAKAWIEANSPGETEQNPGQHTILRSTVQAVGMWIYAYGIF